MVTLRQEYNLRGQFAALVNTVRDVLEAANPIALTRWLAEQGTYR